MAKGLNSKRYKYLRTLMLTLSSTLSVFCNFFKKTSHVLLMFLHCILKSYEVRRDHVKSVNEFKYLYSFQSSYFTLTQTMEVLPTQHNISHCSDGIQGYTILTATNTKMVRKFEILSILGMKVKEVGLIFIQETKIMFIANPQMNYPKLGRIKADIQQTKSNSLP